MRVVILQRRLTHYRVPLFETMAAQLHQAGVELSVVHGQPAPDEMEKQDGGLLPDAITVRNRYLKFSSKFLCWQPVRTLLQGTQLVVAPHENSLLSNLPLLMKPKTVPPLLALWGHGANLQSRSRSGLRERVKRWTSERPYWWFAYTALSGKLVEQIGFDRSRVTVLNNAIDTSELRRHRDQLTPIDMARVRQDLGINDGPVGLFLGSLYSDKRLTFLLQAAAKIRQSIPGFTLLLIGDGTERHLVQDWMKRVSWVRWMGAMHGAQKVRYAAVCDVLLNPGSVGLNALDAFSLGLPMITTEWPYHGPEIAYVEHEVNGLITPDDLSTYAAAVISLLQNERRLQELRMNCLAAARNYTLQAMAERFSAGILAALATAKEANLLQPSRA